MNSITKKYVDKLNSYGISEAIISKGYCYTYSQLCDNIDFYFNNYLPKNNVEEGDVVFILSDYSFDSIALLIALSLNNNIAVPVTTEKEDEIDERIKVSSPDYIINLRTGKIDSFENEAAGRHDLILNLIASQHSGLILFSSGSTGVPKAMIHNLDNLMEQYLNNKSRSMHFLVFLMFDHIGGLNTLLNCLAMGAKIVIPEHREPEYICNLIEKQNIHVLPTSPTFLNLILISESHKKYDLSSLKLITYGTEPMPQSLLNRLHTVLDRVKFLQTFGTSETGIAKTKSESSSSTFIKIDDVNQEYKIVQGELWLRSKTQTLGYMNHSNDRFTEDGWFKTGDLVEEKDGYIRIKGRSEEVINVGGEKVLPAEIESVILELDEINDCVVQAGSNPITGQMVTASISYSGPKEKKEIKKIVIKHCSERLDSYKVPAKITVVEEVEFSSRFKKKR